MFDRFRNKVKKGATGAASGLSTADVIYEFKATPLPDAIDGLLFRVSMAAPNDPSVTGFERYTARLLTEVGAANIRSIAVEHPISVRHLSSTGLLWFAFDASDLTPEQVSCVLGVESALNRMLFIGQALKKEGFSQAAACTEELCARHDWHTMRTIGWDADRYLSGSEKGNDRLTLNGVTGARGGNWDVLTRLAEFCESVVLPYRLDYRLDCDMSCGAVEMHITVPAPEHMPRSRWVEAGNQWLDCAAQRPSAAAAYALRLVMLMTGAAFGASVGVARVCVHGHESQLSNPVVLSLEFERMPFVMGTAPSIKAGALSQETGDFDPALLFSLLHPARWAISPDAFGHNQPVEPLVSSLSERRTPLAQDIRALPNGLANVLHADRVCDLDVMSVQDEALSERLRSALADRDDAPLLATAQLEELLAAGDTASTSGAERADAPLLYCENAIARYLVDLTGAAPEQRYCRASDVRHAARSALALLYLEMGDAAGALAQAETCVKRAPTSASAYQDLITVHASQNRYDLAVDVATCALRYQVFDDAVSYLYYRLAYALWKTGRLEEAVACYGMVPEDAQMGSAAKRELAELLEEMGNREPMGAAEIAATLRVGGIPQAPTDEVVELMSKALIELCDANLPLAAAPLATMLGRIKRDDVLSAIGRSLREG
ncbi:hypothetical protein [Adlercreutzia sp. ZJ141]|uniref:hypothetical protein n=1 Tax=Adlercreutzia sp. ZJ141 TaxID=2709406 RepID=UPI0013EC6422|nr:hypothetical protein [Adlercreutzia sp. ZJ141]